MNSTKLLVNQPEDFYYDKPGAARLLPQLNPHSESSDAVVESEPELESDPQKESSVTAGSAYPDPLEPLLMLYI